MIHIGIIIHLAYFMHNELELLKTADCIVYKSADAPCEGHIEGNDMAVVRQVAELRQSEAERAHLPDRHGFRGDGFLIHYLGALGEFAVAKILGIPWSESVNTFKAPDIADCLQVRTRSKPHYELLVRPQDKDSEYFIHVTADFGQQPPTLTAHGYIEGRDAKNRQYLRTYGGRPPAYFVPTQALLPLI